MRPRVEVGKELSKDVGIENYSATLLWHRSQYWRISALFLLVPKEICPAIHQHSCSVDARMLIGY